MRNKKIKLNKLGFTLVELLVVISIIAILSVVSLASFTRVQIKARDTQRKSDLEAMSKALMMYYNDYGIFPKLTSDELFGNVNVGLTGANEQLYMRQTPQDPKAIKKYIYSLSPSKTSFNLFSILENTDDGQCNKDGYYPLAPVDYCYGVSSPNTVVGITLP